MIVNEIKNTIVSAVDKLKCLETVGTTLGAQKECVGRVYDVTVRTQSTGNGRYTYIANGLYLWISRSGSLREMSESEIFNFPRYSKYLVLHDPKNSKTILLYGVKISNRYRRDTSIDETCITAEADLSIPFNGDIFEAMRFVSGDIITEMYMNEYEKLWHVEETEAVAHKTLELPNK